MFAGPSFQTQVKTANVAASTAAISANLVLTAASGQSQVLAPSAAGLSVVLPDATTISGSALGPQYNIFNASNAYSLSVRRNGGDLLVTLLPGGACSCFLDGNATARGVWHQTNNGGISYQNQTSLTFSTFPANGGSEFGWGKPVTFGNTTVVPVGSSVVTICNGVVRQAALSQPVTGLSIIPGIGVLAITAANGGATTVYAQVIAIDSAGVMTVGSTASRAVTSVMYQYAFCQFTSCMMSVTAGAIFYTTTGGAVYGIAVSISGMVVTLGSAQSLASGLPHNVISAWDGCAAWNATTCMIAFTDITTYNLSAIAVTISGTTLTAGSVKALISAYTGATSVASCYYQNGGIVVFQGSTSSYSFAAIACTISGTTITSGSVVGTAGTNITAPTTLCFMNTFQVNASQFLAYGSGGYIGNGSNQYMQLWTVSGTTLSRSLSAAYAQIQNTCIDTVNGVVDYYDNPSANVTAATNSVGEMTAFTHYTYGTSGQTSNAIKLATANSVAFRGTDVSVYGYTNKGGVFTYFNAAKITWGISPTGASCVNLLNDGMNTMVTNGGYSNSSYAQEVLNAGNGLTFQTDGATYAYLFESAVL